MLDFPKLANDYKQALLQQVVPFCLKYGRDEVCGGYFDQLSTAGAVIEGDKFVARQAEQAGDFAWLYNTLDKQPEWLFHAQHGATFLSRFAHNDTLHGYAQLDRRGRPVAPATDTIPDSFVVMAYAQLDRATPNGEWTTLAGSVLAHLLQRRLSTRTEQANRLGSFRQLWHLSEPIIVLNAVLAMQPLLPEELWKETVAQVRDELLHEFLDARSDTLREFILPAGGFINTPEGRRLNVGLTFRAVNTLFDLSPELRNRKLTAQLISWSLRMCSQAWDELAGGLTLYADIKGQPSVFADWQQKWAWVHLEAISALTKGYFATRHPDCLKWFKRIHDYTFQHFPDSQYGGWHLAIDSVRQPILSAKAIPAVGNSSLIRCFAQIAQTLAACEQIKPVVRSAGMGR